MTGKEYWKRLLKKFPNSPRIEHLKSICDKIDEMPDPIRSKMVAFLEGVLSEDAHK